MCIHASGCLKSKWTARMNWFFDTKSLANEQVAKGPEHYLKNIYPHEFVVFSCKTSYCFSKHGMRYLFYQPEVFNTDSREPNDTKQKSHNILLPHVSTIFHHCPQFNHIHGPSQGFRSEVHFLHVETQAWTFLFSLPKLQYKGTTAKHDEDKVYFLATIQCVHAWLLFWDVGVVVLGFCWRVFQKSMWTEMEFIWDHLIL